MTKQEERLVKIESTLYGNGKRGVLERIGRLEIIMLSVGIGLLTMQIMNTIKLFIK